MGKKILLLGGGGHCKSVIDSLLALGIYECIGIVEKDKNTKNSVLGIPVVGVDDDLGCLKSKGYTDAFVTLGSIGNITHRERLALLIEGFGFNIPNIIDQTAIIGSDVRLGKGVFIGKGTIVNVGSSISDYSIINSGGLIEHDCKIGSFVHVAPGAVLCGEVTVGENTHIGAGAIIKQQLQIGSSAVIGMGSVVIDSIPDNSLSFGNPCRVRGSL